MALITLIGRLNKYFLFIAAIVFFSVGALAQTSQPVCTPSNYAAQVRPEGLTEPVGDLVLVCTGGTAGAVVAPNIFFLTLNTNITNRLDANGIPLGITISVNTGDGAVTSPATVQLYSPTTLGLNGFQYTVPTPATNPVTIDMHGLRAAVATIAPNPNTPTLVTASVTATGLQVTPMQPINLGFVTNPGLLDSVINNEIPCYGPTEPAPSIGFAAFVSSGIFATSVRISEGNATAFATKLAGDDNGTRIVLHISGYGTSTVYVPDAIVGNDGMMPTSDGAFGLAASGGQFTAGSTQLLLSRVNDADVNGVGGVPVVAVPGQTITFDSLTQVTLNNGSAYVVYEVVNANPLAFETAQIPVFILPPAGTMPPNGCATGTQPELSVNLAPVSTVATATATDPLPRFVLVTPPSDCTLNGDCGSSYFPSFSASTATLNLTATAGGLAQTSVLQVTNTSTDAYLSFNVSVTYLSGSNWLTVNPGSGIGTTALVLTANPSALSAGVYNAIITISAGAAGTVSIPVALTVGSATPIIQSVVSAADFLAPVVPGSFIAIFGVTLSGQNPTVTFDGQPAQIVYDGSSQINVLAPATFTGAGSTTSVVVSVNGVASNTFVANTTANAPGIFNPGIRNQDNSINTQSQPATVGSEIQIFLTGFTLPLTVPVTVQIGGQSNLPPVYAGGVPSVPGLDQVNVVVPPSASPGTNGVPLRICIPGLFGTPYCSNAVNLFVQ